jgi:A/G-specific adenine glycosylase
MEVAVDKLNFFQESILSWYKENKRIFPWRKKGANEYHLIISEVLLQRTKAETVANFFPIFIDKYPSWEVLANASINELQEFLKPIGLYKQRGERLFKLAQEIKKRGYKLPGTKEEFEELPLVGQYIANAYDIFIKRSPAPLLDVNMARLLERFFGPRELADIRYDPYLQNLAWSVIKHEHFKELNWGILDFSAKNCTARKPMCYGCALSESCFEFKKSL